MVNFTNFKSVFKSSPGPQLILKPDVPHFTILEVNEAFQKATNTSTSELLGLSLRKAFPANPSERNNKDGSKTLILALQEAVKNKQPLELETLRYDIPVRGSGEFEPRYWIPHIYPVLNEQGEIECILYSPTDVTDLVLTEQETKVVRDQFRKAPPVHENVQQQLAREKRFAESLINSLPGVVYLFDEKRKFHRWNKNLEEITGYSSEEINDLDPIKLIDDDHVEIVDKSFGDAFTKGSSQIEAPLRLKSGQTVPFLFNALAVKLDDKDYLICTGLDLSDLEKERAERLRLSEILEKSRNEIYIFDAQTYQFINVNAGARHNLGFNLEELKKMTPLDIKPNFDLAYFKNLVSPLVDQTEDKIVFNTVHQRADSSLYDVEVHLQLIEQGGQKVFVAIILDITERLKIENELKNSLNEKIVLLNEIHHRVKNNLAIISSLLNMQANTAGDKKLKEMLSESQGRIHTMSMIHEILYKQGDFTKIDFGMYVKKLLQHVSLNYEETDKKIETRVLTSPVALDIGRAVPCALIINELLTNSYKHAFHGRDQGHISILLKKTKDSHLLVFRDDGIGLSPAPDGQTMGLALVQGLVKQISGTIAIDNEDGTTFTISFPQPDENSQIRDDYYNRSIYSGQ